MNEIVKMLTGKMNGLYDMPKYFDEKCCWYQDIEFSYVSDFSGYRLPWILVGDPKNDTAMDTKIKDAFKKVFGEGTAVGEYVYENIPVRLMVVDGSVKAFGAMDTEKWIRVSDWTVYTDKDTIEKEEKETYIKEQLASLHEEVKRVTSFLDEYKSDIQECIDKEDWANQYYRYQEMMKND